MNAWKALALGVVMGFVVSVGYGCSGTPKCDASNCQGCCDTNHKCIATASQTASQCGSSGNACQACQAGQACNPGSSGGSCGACSGSTCDGGACNPNNCPTGCCSSGQCISSLALSNSLCGQGGQACQACLGGTSCQFTSIGGFCSATDGGAGGVGSTCKTNADCSALGAGATCFTVTSIGVVYQGGFCTLDCSVGNCPSGSQCVGVGPDPSQAFGENTFLATGNAFCWPECVATPCREPGYACYGLTQNDGGAAPQSCWLDPPAPDGLVGSACNVDTDCFKPTGPGHVPNSCITQVTDAGCDGGAPFCQTGFTGGYCIADCFNWAQTRNQSIANSYCGDGGVCLGFQTATGVADICWERCATPGTQDVCRSGYICQGVPGGFLAAGRCIADCRNPGFTCATGMTCDAGLCQ